jgi:predicted phosphodiesterase
VPDGVAALKRLPMHRVFQVSGRRIAVIHGDPDNLAGWALAAEALAPPDTALRAALGCQDTPLTTGEHIRAYLERAGADVFACTHTCLPVAQGYRWADSAGAVINNGSAGMPNFSGDPRGLITRIATRPATDALYGVEIDGLHCEALPVEYDARAWWRRFESWWPPGSPAHESYAGRINDGPAFSLAQAHRGVLRLD